MEAELRTLVLRHMIHRTCQNAAFSYRTSDSFVQKLIRNPLRADHISPTGYAPLKRSSEGTLAVLGVRTAVINHDVVLYSRYFFKSLRAHKCRTLRVYKSYQVYFQICI